MNNEILFRGDTHGVHRRILDAAQELIVRGELDAGRGNQWGEGS